MVVKSSLGGSKKCPECGSSHVIKTGWSLTREGRKPRYKCMSCARSFQGANIPFAPKAAKAPKAKKSRKGG